MMHACGKCFYCRNTGGERCSPACVLKQGHDGEHMGWFAFVRRCGRDLRIIVGEKIAGKAAS